MIYYLIKLKGYNREYNDRVKDFKSFTSLRKARNYIRGKLFCRRCRYGDSYYKCECGIYSIHKVVETCIGRGKSGHV